jgi:hypothetical protein
LEAHSEKIAHFYEMVLGMLILDWRVRARGLGVREWNADFSHFSTLLA